MEFRRAFYIEDADVRVLPCYTPEMQPIYLGSAIPPHVRVHER